MKPAKVLASLSQVMLPLQSLMQTFQRSKEKGIAKSMLILAFVPLAAISQNDTIYTSTGRVIGSVKEIGENSIKFTYPNEDLINNLSKNVVRKIVFKSGRVQKFSNSTSYKNVQSGKDYENVTLTAVADEVKGLYKLGEASAKAKGTTTFSSIEKVKERAVRKMKMQAAMEGANIIYTTQFTTTDNIPAETYNGQVVKEPQPTVTTISGICYSSDLPSLDEFKQAIGTRRLFSAIEYLEFKNTYNLLDPLNFNTTLDSKSVSRNVELTSIAEESGLIYMTAKIDKESNQKFRVLFFNNEEFTLGFKTDKGVYNYRVRILN
ncbi:hypothetical protein [Asinibacterium sp. OR53]|uniref:hypothetical protein n=1 Tax=Asinibacterium sp. OR53 TaxID=925409 RepID=UPI0004BABB74|nr:hypothetical protein [Asinibacterium sp. OR53]